MKMDEKRINKSVDDVVSTVKFLCDNDLSHLELSSKIDVLNEKMEDLKTLVIYSDDKKFDNTVCAMQLITNNFNKEIIKNFGRTFSSDFREKQLNFLQNLSNSFDIVVKETDSVPSLPNNKEKTKKEYKKKTNDTKKEHEKKSAKEVVDEIIQDTNEKINNYFESEKDLKEYLNYMSKFHQYSIGNCSLIEDQFKGAIAVGSYKFWNDNGFSIKGKEKGIRILVPAPVKRFIDEKGDNRAYFTATKEEKNLLKKGKLKFTESNMTYKKGYLYDVSQTTATADDLPKIFPNKWLEGDIKDYDKFYKAMEGVANNIGVKIIAPKDELGVCKGVSYTLTKEVALNPRNSQLQNVKTLIHELAHAKLHTVETVNDYSKAEKEFQAEMVAYSVCSYFGIDSSEYSLSYLNHYTKNTDIKEKKKLLNEIKNTSKDFIEIIEDNLSKDLDLSEELSNELSSEIAYETSDEIAQAIADVIDAPTDYDEQESVKEKIKEDVYVKFCWSENESIDDGSIYEFDVANDTLKTLTEIHHAQKKQGYDKTKFEICFDEECTDKFYTGRFDIGDGYANDLREHIYKFINESQQELNISDNTKDALFSTIGISENISKSKELSL